MLYAKLNQNLLKRMLKKDRIAWAHDNHCVYICNAGSSACYRLFDDEYFLKAPESPEVQGLSEKFGRCMIELSKYIPADMEELKPTMAQFVDVIGKKKRIRAEYKTASDSIVYINPELLQYFDAKIMHLYKSVDSPEVYVFEYDICRGLVLPIKI